MKNTVYIVFLAVLFACNSESANDCFQKSGTEIRIDATTGSFEKILVNRNIELILKEGPEIKVLIQSGKNLINDVEAIVVGNELRLSDNNTCNYVRDYAATKVLVTAPNITEIRTSSQFDVSSDGVLSYDSLELFSEDFNVSGTFTVGDFRLQVDVTNLKVTSNNLSSFYVSGNADTVFIGFFSGIGRFEGANLIAQNINVTHRGSNDMIVNPQQSLRGVLRGTGDLISVTEPPIVEIEQLYTGRLYFY
jgi:hypothetical protein